jgi:hypothetical protein
VRISSPVSTQADLPGDVASHELVVAGHDLERHALAGQLGDRVADPGLGWIAEEDHALEDEVVLELSGVGEAGRRAPGNQGMELVGREDPRPHSDQSEPLG